MNLQNEVLKYKDATIKTIQGILKIKSVEDAPSDGYPFGKGVADALNYFLDTAKKLGFSEVQNFDNYIGHIDFGDGDETLAILGHVDVVPEGRGWSHPPYDAKISDNKLYGRGVLDDKGPMITCLYALKALKDLGFKPNKKIRMIIGTNEETNWGGINYYFDTLKMPQPDIAFTPDASFPVIFAEKGICKFKISKKFNNLKDFYIKGGYAINSVCESVVMKLPLSYEDKLVNVLSTYNDNNKYMIEMSKDVDKIILTSHGKSAHGSKPYLGYNAINALMLLLSKINIENSDFFNLVNLFSSCFKMDTKGETLGISSSDEHSGDSSINIGTISLEDNILNIGFESRHPVTVNLDSPILTIKGKVEGLDFSCEVLEKQEPLYVPKDDFLIKTLLSSYRDVTGDVDAQPLYTGGGTYARAVKKGVAFGALLHDQEDNMHQKDEYLELDKLDIWLKIYIEAIYRLSK